MVSVDHSGEVADGPNDPKWIQPYIVPLKLWLRNDPGFLKRMDNFGKL